MNIALPFFVVFIVLLFIFAWKRPQYLFLAWPVLLLVFPTNRTFIGPAPFYWYDAITMLLLFRIWKSVNLRAWPRRIPQWHWWFLGIGLLFGTLFPVFRYGFDVQMLWIYGHVALAWLAFPIGMALHLVPRQETYRRNFALGLIIALISGAIIASLQVGNQVMAETVNNFYYGDMKEHLILLKETGARLSSNRTNGPYGDPNTFGGTTAITCAVTLLLLAGRSRKWALVAFVSAAVVVAMTVSRQVLVASAIGFIIAFIMENYANRLRTIGIVLLVVAVSLASGVIDNWTKRLAKWEGGIGQDTNMTARLVIGPMNLFSVIEKDPTVLLTGVGLDVQKLVGKNDEIKAEVGYLNEGFVSNGFLLSLYYLGIFGFVLMIAFWAWVFKKAIALPHSIRPLGVGSIATSLLLISADNYPFIAEVTVSMLFVLAALIAGRWWTSVSKMPKIRIS